MEFNFLTFNGRCAPLTTPLVVKLGERVRLRLVNFSTADHHPIHLHGHTWWVTGTEGGRIPGIGLDPGQQRAGRRGAGARRRVHRQQPGRLDHALPHVPPHDEPHGVDGRPDGPRSPRTTRAAAYPAIPQNMAGGMGMGMT